MSVENNHFLAGGFHTTSDSETAKIVIGTSNNTTEGEIGVGGIVVRDNFALIDSATSTLVGFRSDDDPDSQKVFIGGNSLSQGLLAQQVGFNNTTLFPMDGAATGAGLPVCGVNFVAGVVTTGSANVCSSAWTVP